MLMQDIFKKYSFHKKISLLGIIGASIITAISINILLVDGTDYGKNLKANVLGAEIVSTPADIYIENTQSIWNIIAGNTMNKVVSIGMSISYNPETTSISDIYSANAEIISLSGQDGISSFILQFPTPTDIKSGEVLLSFQKVSDTQATVNLIQTNFTDDQEIQYELSASGHTW